MSSSLLISLFVFSLIGVGGIAIYVALYGSHRVVEERFNDLAVKIRASQGTFEDDQKHDESMGRMLFKWASARVPAPDLTTASGEKLSVTLQQAGYLGSGKAHTFQVFRVLIAIGLAIVMAGFASLTGKGAGMVGLMAIVGVLIGALVPTFYIRRKARARQMAIATQLSDVLDLLVVCVEAGLGLFEAIKIVGLETERQKQEIGRELGLVATEISAGASLGQALRNLADRTAVEDIKPLAATLIQSEQLGAQIAPALHASSDALRTRRRLRAEEAAQKTTIKILFPLVLFILPAMLAVILGPAIIQIVHTITH
jgi:tight adherence protein C